MSPNKDLKGTVKGGTKRKNHTEPRSTIIEYYKKIIKPMELG